MKLSHLMLLFVPLTMMVSCVAPTPSPVPTLATIPTEILTSHFGIVDAVRQDIHEIATLGIKVG